MSEWSTLDGYEVDMTTDRAVLVKRVGKPSEAKTWIPRSLCMDGEELALRDRDIVVKTWFADKESLAT